MSMTDPIGDFLTRIRNGQQARKKTVSAPASKLKSAIAQVLKDEGYIASFETVETGTGKKAINVVLKYYDNKPVIERIERISKPSLRVYKAKDEIPTVLGGLGVAIISTSTGVLSDKAARAAGQGGEVLCIVA